jgi:hypothetical protein
LASSSRSWSGSRIRSVGKGLTEDDARLLEGLPGERNFLVWQIGELRRRLGRDR